jgi:hypothetical protein
LLEGEGFMSDAMSTVCGLIYLSSLPLWSIVKAWVHRDNHFSPNQEWNSFFLNIPQEARSISHRQLRCWCFKNKYPMKFMFSIIITIRRIDSSLPARYSVWFLLGLELHSWESPALRWASLGYEMVRRITPRWLEEFRSLVYEDYFFISLAKQCNSQSYTNWHVRPPDA